MLLPRRHDWLRSRGRRPTRDPAVRSTAAVVPDTATSPLPDHTTTFTSRGTCSVYDAVHQYATGTAQLASTSKRLPRTRAV